LTVQVDGGGSVFADSPTPDGEPAGVECTASCEWLYPRGSQVVLRAPNSVNGNTFQRFEGCATSSAQGGSLCTLTLTAPAAVRAVFQPPPVPEKVLLTATRTGQGTLTATPDGGSTSQCNPTCSLEVDAGTLVTLTAEAFRGHQITGWDGISGCGTNRECTFAVSSDMPVTVTIEEVLETFDLTVTLTGSGTVSNNGALVCASSRCTIEIREGTTLDLSAAGNSGHLFVGWDDACSGTGICRVTVNSNTSVSASFERPTLTVDAGFGGSVTGPGGLNCPGVCTVTYDAGQEVTLSADPDSSRFRFEGWAGGCDGFGCSLTMDGNKSVTAQFSGPWCGEVLC
jgi:hypothetical protein